MLSIRDVETYLKRCRAEGKYASSPTLPLPPQPCPLSTELRLFSPHGQVPWVRLAQDERIVSNTWLLLLLRAGWMVGPGPQIWQGSQNWYPYPRQTSVWRVSPVINSFPRDERNRPGLQLCSPYKSVLCFFNPIPTSGYTYRAKNVSILLAMFAFQNMGQPQGKSPHKYHAFEKNQCWAFPYLPKMKINVPNHTSLEALHAHELGS